jgi:hypothetical protein
MSLKRGWGFVTAFNAFTTDPIPITIFVVDTYLITGHLISIFSAFCKFYTLNSISSTIFRYVLTFRSLYFVKCRASWKNLTLFIDPSAGINFWIIQA